MRAFINMLLNLPWWVDLAILVALAGLVWLAGWYFRRRFDQIIDEAVMDAGAALRGAEVTVHSVKAVPMPAGPSPYDIDRNDEDFVEGVDDAPWDEDGMSYYAIEATIAPATANAVWDPTALSLVPADYLPDDATEITDQLCPLHSAEIFINGRFLPAAEKDVHGPQRLRMVFAIHDGLRAVKFALFVTYFGSVELPAPLAKSPKATAKR